MGGMVFPQTWWSSYTSSTFTWTDMKTEDVDCQIMKNDLIWVIQEWLCTSKQPTMTRYIEGTMGTLLDGSRDSLKYPKYCTSPPVTVFGKHSISPGRSQIYDRPIPGTGVLDTSSDRQRSHYRVSGLDHFKLWSFRIGPFLQNSSSWYQNINHHPHSRGGRKN